MVAVAVAGLYLGCLVWLLQAHASYIDEMFAEYGLSILWSSPPALRVINGLAWAISLWLMVGLIVMTILAAKAIRHGFFRKP
jgi:hypothetical protein